ncbi:MAG: hypothetical protein OXL36_16815 [Bryobacterales bacterium]|nr:hypothetical protein [Bryobacterales bacterium]MDE0296094.1 hypothetical protein [Bryobacterales bacterium]
MKTKPETIEVMFRKYRDKSTEILAVFPYEAHDRAGGYVTCYAHIGQHGGAQMAHVHSATRPAKPDEYDSLYRELKQIYERPKFPGDPVYKLRIVKRRSSKRMREALEKARR